MNIKSKIWFEANGQMVVSRGCIMLLKKIETTGSLRSAAIDLKMSYQKARKLIRFCNENSPGIVLISQTGGLDGGGTKLTDYGKKLVKLYDDISKLNQDFLTEQFEKLQNE
jgi:molybdate transport system regulatory protein